MSQLAGRKIIAIRLLLPKFLLSVAIGFLIVFDSHAAGVVIPDRIKHAAFLYNEWQPNRPNLTIFIDPLCPYCKKAIPKLDGITDYNVYIFWYPIFGQRSEKIVDPLFQCDHPTSAEILQSLMLADGRTPTQHCGKEMRSQLREINDAVASSYPINGVPSFFVQGRRSSLAQVYSPVSEPAKYVNGVAIDWNRYQGTRIQDEKAPLTMALIFVHGFSDREAKLVRQYRPVYVFSGADWDGICQQLKAKGCDSPESRERNRLYSLELNALLGLDSPPEHNYLIAAGGQMRRIE